MAHFVNRRKRKNFMQVCLELLWSIIINQGRHCKVWLL